MHCALEIGNGRKRGGQSRCGGEGSDGEKRRRSGGGS